MEIYKSTLVRDECTCICIYVCSVCYVKLKENLHHDIRVQLIICIYLFECKCHKLSL